MRTCQPSAECAGSNAAVTAEPSCHGPSGASAGPDDPAAADQADQPSGGGAGGSGGDGPQAASKAPPQQPPKKPFSMASVCRPVKKPDKRGDDTVRVSRCCAGLLFDAVGWLRLSLRTNTYVDVSLSPTLTARSDNSCVRRRKGCLCACVGVDEGVRHLREDTSFGWHHRTGEAPPISPGGT